MTVTIYTIGGRTDKISKLNWPSKRDGGDISIMDHHMITSTPTITGHIKNPLTVFHISWLLEQQRKYPRMARRRLHSHA